VLFSYGYNIETCKIIGATSLRLNFGNMQHFLQFKGGGENFVLYHLHADQSMLLFLLLTVYVPPATTSDHDNAAIDQCSSSLSVLHPCPGN